MIGIDGEVDGAGQVGEPAPADWPVLVTGARGFVGGHAARELLRAGHWVRGLTRGPVPPQDTTRSQESQIEWILGDLRDPDVRQRALRGMRGVIHSAAWVSLGLDPREESCDVNIQATQDLLADCRAAGVQRLVFTSSLHTLAAGTPEAPADEHSPWNLHRVETPYSRSKREAERIVRESCDSSLETVVICPGMVVGGEAPRPTSTRLLIWLARTPVAVVPGGGIPIIDARILAQVHRLALTLGEPGHRYAIVGQYLSYPEQAALVAAITGRPWRVFVLPDPAEGPLIRAFQMLMPWLGPFWPDASAPAIIAGFLRLHVSGARADHLFGLCHPQPIESFRLALEDARRRGFIRSSASPMKYLREKTRQPNFDRNDCPQSGDKGQFEQGPSIRTQAITDSDRKAKPRRC